MNLNVFLCPECKQDFTTKKYFQKYCVPCYRKLYDKGLIKAKEPIPKSLSGIQEEVLIGSLLGDGHLSKTYKPTHNSNFIVVRSVQDTDYLIWQYNIFKNFCNRPPKKIISSRSVKTNKVYDGYGMYTASGELFSNYRKIWYPDGKKIVPNNITLTPLTIAVWIADDGNIRYGRGNKSSLSLTFCTHGFTEDEVNFLINLLNNKYNETFYLDFDHHTGGKFYPVIKGSNKATRTLLEDIDEVFPLERKSRLWRDKEVCFYENKPKSRTSINEFQSRIKPMILSFLKENNKFIYKDIAEDLNWFTSRKGIKEIPSTEIKRYLKPYIKFGVLTSEIINIEGYYKSVFTVHKDKLEEFEQIVKE